MSQKYFYKCTLYQNQSMGCYQPECSFIYEVGKVFTAIIPNSLLIGFRTLREARQFLYPHAGYKSRNKIFRCLPMAPVIRIHRLTEDYTYQGFVNFWYNNRHLSKSKGQRRFEKSSPTGTHGCYQIKVLAEVKTNLPNMYS